MILSRTATELRRADLPGGDYVSILADGPRIYVKRYAARSRVVNVLDRYDDAGTTRLLDEPVANAIVDEFLRGNKSWAACFMLNTPKAPPVAWERSKQEHAFTSTGIKFWRHQQAMESFRAGTGHSVISTHISPEGACTLRCPYCSVTFRETHSRIPLGRIMRYVRDLKSRGLKAVILTGGGEPTLYPDFDALVEWLKNEMGLSVALITNGFTRETSVDANRETWGAFSWVRVSINIFDGWRDRIKIPTGYLAPDCVVGASFVYTLEHEASEDVPLSRLDLLRQVAQVADNINAKYVRLLPNCLLEQDQLLAEHAALDATLAELGDPRFFHQFKIHGAPNADRCHQAYFRPYLSEEPDADGVPGVVYPCDSVVLNDSRARFAPEYQLCKPEQILDFMDGRIPQRFKPRHDCAGCVFTGNVEMLAGYRETGVGRFTDEALVHEEFV
jgi:Radical SAM superfamily